MQVEILDDWDAHFKMSEKEFLEWRGALEEYATAAFLEGKIDSAEAATLSRLAAS